MLDAVAGHSIHGPNDWFVQVGFSVRTSVPRLTRRDSFDITTLSRFPHSPALRKLVCGEVVKETYTRVQAHRQVSGGNAGTNAVSITVASKLAV